MIISKKMYTLILIFFSVLILQPADSHAAKKNPTNPTPSLWQRLKNQVSWEFFGTPQKNTNKQDSSDSDSSDSEEEQETSIPGLENFGNSCYFNATMQCLASLQPLTNCLTQHATQPETFRQSYLDLVNQINGKDNSTITPADFFGKVTNGLEWDPTEQQDAQEFYSALINFLFEELTYDGKAELHKMIYPAIETKIWDDNGHSSINNDAPSPLISLEIKKEKPTLQNCLDIYFEEEELTDDNQWNCETCGTVDAQKQVLMTSFPEILTIQLKRFGFNREKKCPSKNATAVPFPMSLQIQSKWVFEVAQRHCPAYDLVGFVVQGGGLNGGHYWSYTKRNGQWYYCNDTQTEPQTDAQIKAMTESGLDSNGKATPYLLFYQKRNIAGAAPTVIERSDDSDDEEDEDDNIKLASPVKRKAKKQAKKNHSKRKK